MLAQKFVDQVKRESEAEAAATVARAEETARAAVAAAEDAALKLQSESQRKVREEVARLEATRTELAADVESMARHLESERTRLRDALSEILSWVDENVQPANSLMGVASAASPERDRPRRPPSCPTSDGRPATGAVRRVGGRQRPTDTESSRGDRQRRSGGAPPRLTRRAALLPPGPPSAMVTRSPDATVVGEPTTSMVGKEDR